MTPHEAEELAALWTAAQPAVAAFVRSLVRDRGDSEEVLQCTAMTLVRKFRQFDRERPFVAWAIGVAKLEVLGYLRDKRLDRHVFDATMVERIAESHQRLAEERPAVVDLLPRCIGELDGRAHEAIQLRYGKQLKTPQIAQALHLSDGAARMLLTRARTSLRLCLERQLKRAKE